jgi:hypothetical protein
MSNTKETHLVNGEQLDRVSVTFQRRVDNEDYGKNAQTVSVTVTMDVKEDFSAKLPYAIKQAEVMVESVKELVNIEAEKLLSGVKPQEPQPIAARPVKNPYGRKK